MNRIHEFSQTVNEEVGQRLLSRNWVEESDLEEATKKFKEHLEEDDLRQASLLKILCWELNKLNEESLMLYQIYNHTLGFCDFSHYKKNTSIMSEFSLHECWSSLTLPFDFTANTFYVATCHYLSETNVKHWQDRLRRNIVWYAMDLSSLTIALEQLGKPEKSKEKDKSSADSLSSTSKKATTPPETIS